jgi:drug/metabolite transporter (DMT)-like permease
VSHAHLGAGVAISVVSAVFYNVGFVIEKHALERLPQVHARQLTHLLGSVLSSPLWLCGFGCLLVGLGLQVVALSLVSISVVQPIFVSGIVILLALSHVSLGERLGRREWAAVALVVVALLTIALSLDAGSDKASAHGRFGSLALAALPTIAVGVWLFVVADRFGRANRLSHLRAPLFGLSSGLLYGVAALATKAVSALVEQYGVVASIPHVFASAYLYALIATSAIGFLHFQTALQRCPASVVVPVSNVVSSTYVVAVGTVVFSEHLPGSSWKLALRVIGFAGVLVSILILATQAPVAHEVDIALPDVPVPLAVAVPTTETAPGEPVD